MYVGRHAFGLVNPEILMIEDCIFEVLLYTDMHLLKEQFNNVQCDTTVLSPL